MFLVWRHCLYILRMCRRKSAPMPVLERVCIGSSVQYIIRATPSPVIRKERSTMRPILLRSVGLAMAFFCLLLAVLGTLAQVQPASATDGTIPPVAPMLKNTDFECTTGYYSQTNSAG